jgi:hypothetical protein
VSYGDDEMKFTIECEMNDDWVATFLGMLRYMEKLGKGGSSRIVGIYSDGDGSFRPKFTWDNPTLPVSIKPKKENGGNVLFDNY